MPKLTIYTKSYCPYCVRALSVLKSIGLEDYEEISIDGREMDMRRKLMTLTGGRWDVPQVFVEDRYIGDDDALLGMAQSGELLRLLTPVP
jgi:glutaredoxin 3